MKITNHMKITNYQLVDLQSLLSQCTNVPFENLDSFIDFLSLREKLEKAYLEFNERKVKVLESFKVEQKDNMYVFTDHPEKTKIEESLNKLASKDQEFDELKTLKITPIEMARMTAGLKNYQMDFLKYWLVEEKK